ncbi:UBP4-like protein [Mya arenaria]|uniref:ubiquitinyl hydrolase 1 n=1 Tax=Mya arenaria TaxID=6604 RepID=A0ABY7FT51_MYAAR|nr:UBP4-like protein [Mya arenaria]
MNSHNVAAYPRYILDVKWFKQWKSYVGYDSWDNYNVGDDSANPGHIDNTPLFEEGSTKMKEHLIDDLDYTLVPAEAWEKLVAWYTLFENQEPLPRKVIEEGVYSKSLKVEVYPWNLKICENSKTEEQIIKEFSRSDTIEQLEKTMRQEFNINEDKEVRLWNRYMTNMYEPLNKKENTLQDAGLYSGQFLIWQHLHVYEYIRNTYGGDSNEGGGFYNRQQKSVTPGLCGLSNIGNTCFMNSALQCMSNVPHLTEYFRSGKWANEVNEDNPLGMHGEIARSYAELIDTIWSGNNSFTVPRNFKYAVGRFAPQFSGYQQQDSQELMAFLLDGLHEDLNRIKKKPYVELNDAENRPDEVVAQEAWDNYLKRNDSIITDLFHGLLKSTVQCPECSKISVTFDPFCYLSLPLPVKKERQLEVFWVPLDPRKKPEQFKLTVAKMGQIMDRDDIFIYEVPNNTHDDSEMVVLPVYMREERTKGSYNSGYSTFQLFSQPILVPVPRHNCTYEELYNRVLTRLARFVNLPSLEERWWETENGEELSSEEVEDNNSATDSSDDSGMEISNGESTTSEDTQDSDISSKVPAVFTEQNVETVAPKVKQPPKMFRFSVVNSYGTAEMEYKLKDDGRPLKLSSRMYISLDWHPQAKEKFYVDSEAESFEVHDTMRNKPQKKQVIQLGDCLELFTTTEELGEHDPWYCPQCKKHQQATKKFDLWSLPDTLIIHLKRFSYNRYWRDKIDALVEFPARDHDLNKYVIDPSNKVPYVYDLIGVVNHYGGLGGGHLSLRPVQRLQCQKLHTY